MTSMAVAVPHISAAAAPRLAEIKSVDGSAIQARVSRGVEVLATTTDSGPSSIAVSGRLVALPLAVLATNAGRRLKGRKLRSKACRRAEVTEIPPELRPQTKDAPENLTEWRKQATEKMKVIGGPWPPPKNDRLLRAARGEPVDRPPKWMMRQAGRYLPEYMATLKNTDFFTVCRTPALACEVTLQPIRRYPTLDSMIIFSDILVIPVAMGMPCFMDPGTGPKFDFAIETPKDLERLNMSPDVEEQLGFVFDAVFWTRQRSGNEIPVIGFCGAPWTLMGYMVEGGAVRNFSNAKKWLYMYPEESKKLMRALRDILVEYLVGQYDAGAPLLTVFDTNCGEIPPSVYEEFCVSDLKYIAEEVKRRRPHALMSIFPKDGEIATFNDSAYDVVGCSWTTSPTMARSQCPDKTLQGNLDPFLLYADPKVIEDSTLQMVSGFGIDRYIANLGHGMLPNHPVEGPKAFIEAIDKATKGSAVDRQDARAANGTPAPKPSSGAAPGSQPLVVHLQEDTTVQIPFTQSSAAKLQQSLRQFIATFKQKMSGEGGKKKWDDFEFKEVQGDLKFELFCNLNAYATIFDVKMFLTVRSGEQIRVSSELPLSTLQSDVEAYMA